jgi:hypothetical protein
MRAAQQAHANAIPDAIKRNQTQSNAITCNHMDSQRLLQAL